MRIIVTYGLGVGSTKLSAFDKALFDAGIGNYNLIKLSSVIPEGAKVEVEKIDWNQKEHGYKLYVVLSQCIKEKKGAYAGLGWVQDKTGKGLFVEQAGFSAEEVKDLINRSLESMLEYRPEKYGEINYKIVGTESEGKPVCALVCAIYKSEGWEEKP